MAPAGGHGPTPDTSPARRRSETSRRASHWDMKEELDQVPLGTEKEMRVRRRGEFKGFCASVLSLVGGRPVPLDEYTWFEHTLVALKNTMPDLGLHELEDDVTTLYIEAVKAMEHPNSGLAPPYKMSRKRTLVQDVRDPQQVLWAREKAEKAAAARRQQQRHMLEEEQAEKSQEATSPTRGYGAVDWDTDEEEEGSNDHPRFPPTDDMYQFLTWKWLRKRIELEDQGVAYTGVMVFWLSVLQTALAATILGVGSRTFVGGNVSDTLATCFTGALGILASVWLGMRGVLGENEVLVRAFFLCQLWMLACVTAYLYVTLGFLFDYSDLCGRVQDLSAASTGAAVAAGQCDEDRKYLLIQCALNLCIWLSIVAASGNCLEMLDGLNDRDAIMEDVLVFKFFQRKLDEMELQLQWEEDRRIREAKQVEEFADYQDPDEESGDSEGKKPAEIPDPVK
eukprot:TRINITY_DN1182_c1_g1_i1.p2 TRINITY_DN1182_c1_g1~~TRINITY_DN1182_c1_g1_i1.p2  ORF type:complete len:486 (+),score=177.15 TRINITY_DN1182_c1_g1_i1:105-1460(+)